MKRFFYIVACMVLGLLLATLVHAAIEIPTLRIMTGDMAQYGDGFVWRNWKMIHGVAGNALWFGGAMFGLLLGRKWWRILYVEKRYGEPRW